MLRYEDFLLGRRACAAGLVSEDRLWALYRRLEHEPDGLGLAELLVAGGVATREELGALARAGPGPAGVAQVADGAPTLTDSGCATAQPSHSSPPPASSAILNLPLPPIPSEASTLLGSSELNLMPGPTGGAAAVLSQGPGAAPNPGRLFGKYELLDVVGHGGMGVVYKARDRDLGRVVALKTLLAGSTQDPNRIARFYREVRMAASLCHPAILPIHDVGCEGGFHYFTMDLVEGETLEARLAAGRPELRQGVEWVRGIAEALDFAHAQGVVHRDVKPSNILIDRAERPFLSDFGLARGIQDATELTASGAVVGTPSYMAPEQAGGVGPIDGRCDVFSLGAVLYKVLAGVQAFTGDSPAAVMHQTLLCDPPPLRKRDPSLPRDLEVICHKALEKEPARRYATAGHFAADLGRYLAGEPILARPLGVGARLGRWARRFKLPLAAAVVAVAAVGLAWRERAGREAQADSMLEEAAGAVERFEDAAMRHPMTPAVRKLLATQPSGLLDRLLVEAPEFGPLYAWRGKLHDLVGEEARAEDDYGEGCRRGARYAIVWFLRGTHRIARYVRVRGLPTTRVEANHLEFVPPREETPDERACREGGLADLEEALASGGGRGLVGRQETKLARAMSALYAGREGCYESALGLLEGVTLPTADRLRGIALYHLQRFGEAREAFGRCLAEWPEDVEAYHLRAHAAYASGIAEAARGEDPRAFFEKGIADLDEALRREPGRVKVYNSRGAMRHHLAQVEASAGIDPRGEFEKACADYGEAITRDAGFVLAYTNRGFARLELSSAIAAHDEDPTPALRLALADLDQAVRLAPEFADAYNNRGNAWKSLGLAQEHRGEDASESFRRGETDYKEAVARGNPTAYLNLGVLLRCMGRNQDAIAAFEAGARAAPAHADWARQQLDFTRRLIGGGK
ncbi:MAG: protein kinase [Planctomycetes bacterium]|nr:protein kinase [Planctomycetota bacterium]